MYKLYEFGASGNCYKLRLAMSHLEIDYERVTVDITRGESRTEAFLKINPNGRIPVLQTPDGDYLPESNAALWFLGAQTALCPAGKLQQAKALQWMFFEQYSHEPFIATSRYWIMILNAADKYKAHLDEKRPGGYAALGVMERHLDNEPFFVGQRFSIADIALYAYTHVAEEGGFDLAGFPAIKAWFQRIEQVKNYLPITA